MPYPYTWTPTHVTPVSASQVRVVKKSTGANATLTTPIAVNSGVITFTLANTGVYKIIVSTVNKKETGTFTVDPTNTDISIPEFITIEHVTSSDSTNNTVTNTTTYITKAELDNPNSDVRSSLNQSLDNTYIRIPSSGTLGQVLVKTGSNLAQWSTLDSDLQLNVKRQFGAIGDGVVDDTAAIQAALDAVPSGGGIVYLPAGRYKVSSTLQIKQNGTKLLGDGAANSITGYQPSAATRLEATSTVTGSVLLVQRSANDIPLQGVALEDFTIDGGLFGTAVDGIIFRSNQGYINRVNIWRMSGAGLRILGYTSPAWDTYDSIFDSLLIGNCAGAGVYLDTGSSDTHWSHCIILANQDNLVIKGSSGQFTGCHFYDPVRHNIWFNGAGSRSKFANCKIEGILKNDMVLIDSAAGGYADIQFTGCGFASHQTSGVSDNTYDYVKITGPSGIGIGRTTFVGNSFTLKGGSTLKARYAINLETAAAQNTVILANSFGPASHWGTGALNNATTSSLLSSVKGNSGLGDLILPTAITTAYTLTSADASNVLEVNSATPVTITVPTIANSGFAKGNIVDIVQVGVGTVTIAAASGVTLRVPANASAVTPAQWSKIRLRMRASNEWILELPTTNTGSSSTQTVDWVNQNPTTKAWPARPTASSSVMVIWKGVDPFPAIVASGTGGMLDNVDIKFRIG